MIKGVCLPRLCVHPLSACQSGLKVVVYRTNMCVLESANERRECLHVALIPFVWGLVPPYVRLIAAIKRRASALTLKDKEDKKKAHIKTRGTEYFSSIVDRQNPHLKRRNKRKGGLLLWLSSWRFKGRCWVHYSMDPMLFQSEKTSAPQ